MPSGSSGTTMSLHSMVSSVPLYALSSSGWARPVSSTSSCLLLPWHLFFSSLPTTITSHSGMKASTMTV